MVAPLFRDLCVSVFFSLRHALSFGKRNQKTRVLLVLNRFLRGLFFRATEIDHALLSFVIHCGQHRNAWGFVAGLYAVNTQMSLNRNEQVGSLQNRVQARMISREGRSGQYHGPLIRLSIKPHLLLTGASQAPASPPSVLPQDVSIWRSFRGTH